MVTHFVKTQEHVFKVRAAMGLFSPIYLVNSDNSVFIQNLKLQNWKYWKINSSEIVVFVLSTSLAGCFSPGPFSDACLPGASLPPGQGCHIL